MIANYMPKEHPLKSILMKDYQLSLAIIANFIGKSYSYTSAILAGKSAINKYDAKLYELLELCKKERAGND